MTTTFFAYPSGPRQLLDELQRAVAWLKNAWGDDAVHTWEDNDVAGRNLLDPIVGEIQARELVVADVTFANFNVTYEFGFAIGTGKRAVPTVNVSVEGDRKLHSDIGIFDTLGRLDYSNHAELVDRLTRLEDFKPLKTDFPLNKAAPIYFVGAQNKSSSLLHIVSRVKATKYRYREFNPYEQLRLAATEAIEEVASSALVIVPLLAPTQTGAKVHNIRAAFVAGLAHGMGVPCLLLQPEGGPVPLDVRDLVKTYQNDRQVDEYIADALPAVVEALYRGDPASPADAGLLGRLDFGQYFAENETGSLSKYYLPTDQFRTVLAGGVRLVVGRKGSGKTAVFMQACDRWKPDKSNVVVDLQPEGFRLVKLRDAVLRYLADGTRDQFLAGFWEYLLLLEICATILEQDYQLHIRNHELYEPYQNLAALYREGGYAGGTGFSERMVQLIDRLFREISRAIRRNASPADRRETDNRHFI